MAGKKASKKTPKKTSTKKAVKKAATKKKVAKKAPKKAAKKTTKKAPKKSVKKAAKKAPKKTSTKKTHLASKAAASAAAARAMQDIIARARDHFKEARSHEHFHLTNGERFKNLRELADALEAMHEHVFYHHVNDNKHDFAEWVEKALHEKALADELRRVQKHPLSHQRVIYRHIVRRVW